MFVIPRYEGSEKYEQSEDLGILDASYLGMTKLSEIVVAL
jgi:hypothetical protein